MLFPERRWAGYIICKGSYGVQRQPANVTIADNKEVKIEMTNKWGIGNVIVEKGCINKAGQTGESYSMKCASRGKINERWVLPQKSFCIR